MRKKKVKNFWKQVQDRKNNSDPPTLHLLRSFTALPAEPDAAAARRSSLWSSPCCTAGTSACQHDTWGSTKNLIQFQRFSSPPPPSGWPRIFSFFNENMQLLIFKNTQHEQISDLSSDCSSRFVFLRAAISSEELKQSNLAWINELELPKLRITNCPKSPVGRLLQLACSTSL